MPAQYVERASCTGEQNISNGRKKRTASKARIAHLLSLVPDKEEFDSTFRNYTLAETCEYYGITQDDIYVLLDYWELPRKMQVVSTPKLNKKKPRRPCTRRRFTANYEPLTPRERPKVVQSLDDDLIKALASGEKTITIIVASEEERARLAEVLASAKSTMDQPAGVA